MSSSLKEVAIRRINELEDYSVSDDFKVVDKSGNCICNFIPVIDKQVNYDDGKSKETIIEIYGISSEGEVLPTVNVEASEVYKFSWVDKNWGFDSIIYPKMKKELMILMKLLAKQASKITRCSHLGWRKFDESWVYLHSDGCIGNDDVETMIDKHLDNYKMPSKVENIKVACNASLALINVAGNLAGIVLLALTYLAPLIEAIINVDKAPEFVVWIHGVTGSRKTSLSKVFLSHFGSFINKVPASFNDTYASLELKGFRVKDSLLLCDDYCPQQSARDTAIQNSVAEKLIRSYGDRVSRGRLNTNLESQTQFTPRGMLAITGEMLMQGHSTNARLIPVEITQDSIDLTLLTKAQEDIDLLSQAMRGYIEWILPNMNEDIIEFGNTLKDNFNTFRSELNKINIQCHGRTIEACAWIMTSFNIMLQYFSDVEAVSENQVEQLMEKAKSVSIDIMNSQAENMKINKPHELFIDTVRELISSKSIEIRDLRNKNSKMPSTNNDNVVGLVDDDYYYFYPQKIYSIARSRLNRMGIYLNTKDRELWSQLKVEGLIKVDKDSCLPKKTINIVGIAKIRQRLLHIKRSVIDE